MTHSGEPLSTVAFNLSILGKQHHRHHTIRIFISILHHRQQKPVQVYLPLSHPQRAKQASHAALVIPWFIYTDISDALCINNGFCTYVHRTS